MLQGAWPASNPGGGPFRDFGGNSAECPVKSLGIATGGRANRCVEQA
jgi:hypothetical protein